MHMFRHWYLHGIHFTQFIPSNFRLLLDNCKEICNVKRHSRQHFFINPYHSAKIKFIRWFKFNESSQKAPLVVHFHFLKKRIFFPFFLFRKYKNRKGKTWGKLKRNLRRLFHQLSEIDGRRRSLFRFKRHREWVRWRKLRKHYYG